MARCGLSCLPQEGNSLRCVMALLLGHPIPRFPIPHARFSGNLRIFVFGDGPPFSVRLTRLGNVLLCCRLPPQKGSRILTGAVNLGAQSSRLLSLLMLRFTLGPFHLLRCRRKLSLLSLAPLARLLCAMSSARSSSCTHTCAVARFLGSR